jgi:tetratricopeptide (TPR) repeat protein
MLWRPSKHSCSFWSVLLFALSARLSADDLIAAARNQLYRDRAEAISILEKAVRESPQRTDYWIEYVRALSISSEDQYVADCTSRAALAIHPQSGELWQARMALFQAPAALDLMPKLEGIAGYEERAKDAREILEIDHLKVPFTWDDRRFHGLWSAALIDVGRWERAEEIAQRGLALFPNDGLLHACRAMVLAHRDEFDEALTEQEQDGIPHSWYQPRLNWGLADLLILKGRADLAVKSFGEGFSSAQIPEGDRLVCAQSLLLAGDSERAEAALQKCKDGEARLLRIADGLRRNKIDEARVHAQKLVQAWADHDKQHPRLSSVPFYRSYAPSVAVSLTAAIDWLQQEFPNEESRIRKYVVRPREIAKTDLDRKTLSASQQIAQLREKILAAGADEKWKLRNTIIGILRTAGQYEEAAAECAANALDDHPKGYNSGLMINPAAVHWSVCKRQAEGAVFFTQHPEMIWGARDMDLIRHSLAEARQW